MSKVIPERQWMVTIQMDATTSLLAIPVSSSVMKITPSMKTGLSNQTRLDYNANRKHSFSSCADNA